MSNVTTTERRPDDRGSESPESPRRDADQGSGHRLTIALGSSAVLFIALELTIIAVAFPDIASSFPDSSRATLSWIFTAYNVGVAAFLLIGGWLAERFGRRKLFLTGLAVFTIGSLASGVAPAIEILIAARVVQAVGGAFLIPASLAVVLNAVPADRHEVAIGVWGAMAGLAAAVGPTLGAVLVNGIGWRAVFLVNVPPAIVVAIVGRRHLDESRDPHIERGVDLLAVPAGAMAIGLLVFIIVAAGSIGWTSPVTIGTAAVAIGLLAVFVGRSRRHPRPVFDPTIATRRSFVVGSIGTLTFVAGFTGWLVFAPTFLTEVWGYSILRAGFAIAPGPLAMAVTAGPAGRIAAKVGPAKVITAGAMIALAATVWLTAMVGQEPDYVFDLLPASIMLGIGVGAGFPMLTAATMADVEARRYAMGAAGSTTVRQLAMAIGIALATAVIGPPDRAGSSLGAYNTSWMICGVLFGLTALVMTTFATTTGDENHG
ncbi:MAG: DHA2 family efflux MFS transporter permease subunit [Acidimicrobiales bacterium]